MLRGSTLKIQGPKLFLKEDGEQNWIPSQVLCTLKMPIDLLPNTKVYYKPYGALLFTLNSKIYYIYKMCGDDGYYYLPKTWGHFLNVIALQDVSLKDVDTEDINEG